MGCKYYLSVSPVRAFDPKGLKVDRLMSLIATKGKVGRVSGIFRGK